MIPSQSVLQLETYRGIMADAFVTTEPNLVQGILAEFGLPINNPLIFSANDVVRVIPAKMSFPKFGLSLDVLVESAWSAKERRLILRIELDEGVTFVWQTISKPVERGEKVLLEGAAGINIVSPRPKAHFIAATLQSLLMLDDLAVLCADQPEFTFNIHFTDSLETVSTFLQRRQIVYRLMVIERVFNLEFSIPRQISSEERSSIDFVYRAVTEHSFAWPFYQDSFDLSANDHARKLLTGMDGKHEFKIEIDCLQQNLLGQTLNLGEAKLNIQNAALVDSKEVMSELQKLDGHSFPVLIRSLSGTANYHFPDEPRLPTNPWEKRVAELVELEDKLGDSLFQAVNELAAATLADLTEPEKAAITERFTLGEEAFADPELEGKNDGHGSPIR